MTPPFTGPTTGETPVGLRRRPVRPDAVGRLTAPPQARAERAGYRWSKRTLDVVVSALLLLLLLPTLCLLAAAVRLTSPGPALFRQSRVGRGGRSFEMLKFRSMRVDTDDASHRAYVTSLLTQQTPPDGGAPGVYKLVSDPRVTGLGRFLRRTSLDELPQLFNVLRGDMSLVGPRPALAWEVALFEPVHRQRMDVLPGLTGLWQVSGRSALTMRQALDLDVEYVARRSLRLDLRILCRTPAVLLNGSCAR